MIFASVQIYSIMLELILIWMQMQGIKFRDFMSVVCTSRQAGMAVQQV